jgi:hypothetical protein
VHRQGEQACKPVNLRGRTERFVSGWSIVRSARGAVILAVLQAVGCGSSSPPSESSVASPPSGGTTQNYVIPPEGTASLVPSLSARRDQNGQVSVSGRVLLPAGARIWVEVYPVSSPAGADPMGRSELYLDAGGAFEAGPFKLPAGTYRVQVTSHFNPSWQRPEVMSLIGPNGSRLPKSALRLRNPAAQSGGYLEYSGSVTVGP